MVELRVTAKEYEGRDSTKLDIVIAADELYVIRTGIETNFAKTFLLAVSLVEDFNKSLIISTVAGDKNTVFCRLYDAQTKTKFKREWDNQAGWFSIIAFIQSKLSTSSRYELDEQDVHSHQAAATTVVQPPSPTPTKPNTIHPQDLRVKQIRTLTNYPIDLVKEWLQFQNASAPSELPVSVVDKLVRDICLAWAADKVDPNHAASSYQQQVLDAIATGVDEVTAIQTWMNYLVGQRTAVSSRS
ncbi:MAG: hypothetical protein RMX96_35005 [Nostoc sp. ChiSLP02]|nr:hypothetical protein [Nostoc sp. DedSLP05]MDZ8097908.1 hypothetical protein [Nostoc sp. DedSLP01]MDZ8190032.1 hypothetical protein [Nostoc sp. ChiSLP02]